MKIAIAADVKAQAEGYGTGNEQAIRAGVVLRHWLLTEEAPDGLGFRFFISEYSEGEKAFESPRHHHGFQQIRWTVSGSVNFAPHQDIAEGDLAYFPRGTFYGPQRKDQGVGLLLQFGFGDEYPAARKDRNRRRQQGLEVMAATSPPVSAMGTAPSQVEDLQLLGESKLADREERSIPPEGYDAPILMHPQAYAYFEAAPGVEVKHLGGFYDHPGPNADVRISMIRLSEGGAYTLSADRAQLVWTTSAGLQVEGRTYPELTSLYSPRDEEVEISAADGLEVYLVEFPRLD